MAANVRTLLSPVAALAKGHEPAITAWAVGMGIQLAAHYQLHLSASNQALLATVVGLLVAWVVRQSVVPIAKLPAVADDTASDAELDAGVTTLGLVLAVVVVIIAVWLGLAAHPLFFLLLLLLAVVLLV